MWGSEPLAKILGRRRYSNKTWATLALSRLAELYEDQMNDLRDTFGSIELDSSQKGISRAAEVHRSLLTLQRDAVPFALEVQQYCSDGKHFAEDIMEFSSPAALGNVTTLSESLHAHLTKLVDRIQSRLPHLDSTAQRTSTLLATEATHSLTRSNLRLQRGVFWMTLALLFLTLVLVITQSDASTWLARLLQ